jgi:hypothetical protein
MASNTEDNDETLIFYLTLQREHLLAKVFVEVFSVTKFDKIFKKTSATTSSIGYGGFSGGFNGCSI